jgi:indole-3-glycerol phosphate synthase
MAFLEQILQTKKAEISWLYKTASISLFREYPLFDRTCHSLKKALVKNNRPGIIAEYKQRSPSKGWIHQNACVEEITRGYAEAGALGLSVLTDRSFFGGNPEDLEKTRKTNPFTPVLRKDFILDSLQVYESKALGADVILLIAACLTDEKLHTLAALGKELGLEILVEIHHEEEIERIPPWTDIVGVNNRNLHTFEVDIQTSVRLAPRIPDTYGKISESGLSEPSHIALLTKYGFQGFLMGETFMKTDNPALACKKFLLTLNPYHDSQFTHQSMRD